MNPTNPHSNRTKPAAPNQARPDLPLIGRFQVLAELGRGGMGAVYRARDPELNREVAIKVLPSEYARDPVAKARFLREARAQAAVEHEHVVTIYDAQEENGVVYIVMPVLKGQPLSAALKQNPRPPVAELVRIGREIAEGLAAAHAAGLVHRDIKPGNVWLEAPKRRVKILDFGIARGAGTATGSRDDANPLTRRNELLGTPQYMSPEQARSKPVDFRSDLFSLGVVLYQMATGERPFNGDGEYEVMAAVVNEYPPPVAEVVPGFPPVLSDLIDRLLAKDPAMRPASALAVAEELEHVLNSISMRAVVVLPLPDAASDAPNPWAELDTTHGREREPETRRGEATRRVQREPEPEDEDEGGTETRTYRAARGGAPKWLLPAALVGLLLAVGLVALLWPKGKDKDGSAKANPREKEKGPELNRPTDPERSAAEWALSVGGKVKVSGPPTNPVIEARSALPKEPFWIGYIELNGNRAVTDAALARFAVCRNVAALGLTETAVTDSGLEHFRQCAGLTYVYLSRTAVTQHGLNHLRAATGLLVLAVDHTSLDSSAVPVLKQFAALQQLNVRDTNLSAADVAQLRAALPKCEVLANATGAPPAPKSEPPTGIPAGLYFDGETAAVTIPKWSFDGKLPLTVEAWVTPASFGKDGSDRHLLLFGTQMGGSGGVGFTPADGLGIGVRATSDFAKNYTDIRFKAGERIHVAAVVSQKRIELFANGKEVGWKDVDLPAQLPAIDGPAVIGKTVPAGGLNFHGTLHGLRVSRAVRYVKGKDFDPPLALEKDADTLLLYKFDEGDGTTLRDHSGNKRDGEIVGGKWVTK